jgi:hypothetical protein
MPGVQILTIQCDGSVDVEESAIGVREADERPVPSLDRFQGGRSGI